jgi:C4-dicarboxylate-specific signal transduction histidine kinase
VRGTGRAGHIHPIAAMLSSWGAAERTRRIDAAPYAMALLLVIAALGASAGLQHVFAGRPPQFPLFAAVAAAAWLGGIGSGTFALALAAPMGIYFFSDATAPRTIAADLILLLFFASCTAAGVLLNARQRRAEDGLRRSHRQLASKAAELEKTNLALMAEITERLRAEQSLEQTRTELARVARLTTMGELAASIAHEINQPLTAVATNAGTCLRWLDAPVPDHGEIRAAVGRIARDVNRAGEVIGRVRAMVRKALPERAPVDVNATVADVAALLENEMAKHRVAVRTEFAPHLPPVAGDRIQLQQVVVNLMMNAADALSAVSGRARQIVLRTEPQDAGAVAITVQDSGDGFADGVLDRLFQAFVTTKPSGMGLGLSICRSIVEAHGGTLTAANGAPHGAVFRIVLPGAEP